MISLWTLYIVEPVIGTNLVMTTKCMLLQMMTWLQELFQVTYSIKIWWLICRRWGTMASSNGSIFCITGPLCRGIHWSPVNSPHKGQWHRALMFSLICTSINGWVSNRAAGDLRHLRAHYDIIVMNYLTGLTIICHNLRWIKIQSMKFTLTGAQMHADITGATILTTCHVVKSLPFIWKSANVSAIYWHPICKWAAETWGIDRVPELLSQKWQLGWHALVI